MSSNQKEYESNLNLHWIIMYTFSLSIPKFPDFKTLVPDDFFILKQYVNSFPPYSDYNIASIWSYDIRNDCELSNLYGNLVIRLRDYINNDYNYSFLGTYEVEETVTSIMTYLQNRNIPLRLKLITEPSINALNNLSPKFVINEDRDNFDYIYDISDIKILPGAKFENKRYWLNKFIKNYPNAHTIFLDINDVHTRNQILNLFTLWQQNKKLSDIHTSHELEALKRFLTKHQDFLIDCIGVYYKNELIAFTFYELLQNNFAILHFTKANTFYKGIFEYLYQSTATILMQQGYKFLNREQDLGISGLRQAKEQWHPIFYLKKYTISLKETLPLTLPGQSPRS